MPAWCLPCAVAACTPPCHPATPCPRPFTPPLRYLDLIKGKGGQALHSPLPDIMRFLGGGSAGTTIIYTHRREDANTVAAALRQRGIACAGEPLRVEAAAVLPGLALAGGGVCGAINLQHTCSPPSL